VYEVVHSKYTGALTSKNIYLPTQARAVQEKENAKKAAAAPKLVPKAVFSLKRALYV
jgi:hypothetical protein